MRKYSVYPANTSLSIFESQLQTLKTYDKKEALIYAKKLISNNEKVSFNCDVYKKGICIKNEFGFYLSNGEINIYSIINYSVKKFVEPIKINHSEFWGDDILSKIK